MWKKDETSANTPTPGTPPDPEPVTRRDASAPSATIGRSITIHGEVTGEEDLLVQGHVEGSIRLRNHSVTIGSEGEVKASITGRVVTVEGKVEGDLKAEEQVILMGSAEVLGDITAPRVVLKDGARLRGGVDMGDRSGSASSTSGESRRDRPAASSKPEPVSTTGKSQPGKEGEPPDGEDLASAGKKSTPIRTGSGAVPGTRPGTEVGAEAGTGAGTRARAT